MQQIRNSEIQTAEGRKVEGKRAVIPESQNYRTPEPEMQKGRQASNRAD